MLSRGYLEERFVKSTDNTHCPFELRPVRRTVKNIRILRPVTIVLPIVFLVSGMPREARAATAAATYAAQSSYKARPVVYGLPDSRISYTFLTVPVLRTDIRSADLCMDMPISENDTQLFAKSCVSLSEYAGVIHKTER